MLKSCLATISTVAVLAAGAIHTAGAQNQGKPAATSRPAQTATLSEQEAYEIAKDAYVYAYPLVLTHTTLQKFSNFAEPVAAGSLGPPNQFHHSRVFPNPSDKVVIRPNVDTLYSPAVLDLRAEPIILSVPATDRFSSAAPRPMVPPTMRTSTRFRTA